VGIFAAGQKPSGNKDPFALRRAALGIARTLTEAKMEIPLDTLLGFTQKALVGQVEVAGECLAEARAFLLERLRQNFLDKGFTANVVNAVFAAPVGTLPDLESRLLSLAEFMTLPEAERLVAANKRIGNILRKADTEVSSEIDEELLNIDEERSLFDEINRITKLTSPLFANAEYGPALTALAGLDEAIEAFFEQVMVMDEDLRVRSNRLAILFRLKGLFDRVADLAMAG
jgi:glycyl-tRNA synthetase beta chain